MTLEEKLMQALLDLGKERVEHTHLQLTHALLLEKTVGPVPMILTCPSCNARHIDEGEFATRVHHTHACQSCGIVWRPALVPTVGVRFLPGFKNG